jgi:type IV pilus assembly protein PilC
MTAPHAPAGSFRYEAQADDGARLTGTVDAGGPDAAVARLESIGLRAVHVEPLGNIAPPRALRAADFQAFNQQLAHLAKAGLPLEHGLRLIATDFRRGRLASTIHAVADELERGTPLAEAFDKHRARFPSLYGRMIDAGVRSNNLAGVLLTLGNHLELIQRLRSALWRALAYPIAVAVAVVILLVFLGYMVLPKFQTIFYEFRLDLPVSTKLLLQLSNIAPALLALLVVFVVGVPLLWALMKLMGRDRWGVDYLLVPLPVVGRVVRLGLVARWCDALKLAVAAGLDLPAAIELASDATGSPRLRSDGDVMIQSIQAGIPLDARRGSMLPATVPAAIQLAAGHHDLPSTLQTLADLYRRLALERVAAVPAVLAPLMLALIAVGVGFVVAALMMPLVSLIQGISSTGGK